MSTTSVLQTPRLPLNLPSSPLLGKGDIDDSLLNGEAVVEPYATNMSLHSASLSSRSCTSLASLTLTNGSSSTLTEYTFKPLAPLKKPPTKQEVAAVLKLLESMNSHVEEEAQRLKAFIRETRDCIQQYKRERREQLIQKKKPRFGDRLRVLEKGMW
jgi:DNA gyrase/topoisomerase IV subunit A